MNECENEVEFKDWELINNPAMYEFQILDSDEMTKLIYKDDKSYLVELINDGMQGYSELVYYKVRKYKNGKKNSVIRYNLDEYKNTNVRDMLTSFEYDPDFKNGDKAKGTVYKNNLKLAIKNYRKSKKFTPVFECDYQSKDDLYAVVAIEPDEFK